VRVLAAGHRRHLRWQFQGAKRHELQLVAGAGHEGAGPAAWSMHQRLAHTAGFDAPLHQHALADGRVGAELFRSADRYTHQFPVSENRSRAGRFQLRAEIQIERKLRARGATLSSFIAHRRVACFASMRARFTLLYARR